MFLEQLKRYIRGSKYEKRKQFGCLSSVPGWLMMTHEFSLSALLKVRRRPSFAVSTVSNFILRHGISDSIGFDEVE
jgi:hypothetical protein